MKRSSRHEVRNLILMFGSGILAAFLVIILFVYYFGSSGTYLLQNILISPAALEGVSFSDRDHPSKKARFVFNKIEFVRAQSSGREWGRYAVSPESYAVFYKKVDKERSIPLITDEIIQQFEWIVPSTLTIFVSAPDNLGSASKSTIFQRIEFLDQDDVFRVQHASDRRDGASKQEWVYFRYPGIYNIILELFAPPLNYTQTTSQD